MVAVCARYIWVGKLVDIDGPFLYMTEVRQVTDHGMSAADAEREGMPLSEGSLNLGMVEEIYPADAAEWSKAAYP